MPLSYVCALGPESASALESLSGALWNAIEFSEPVERLGSVRIRTGRVRIHSDVGRVIIMAGSVDIARKLEAFRIHVLLENSSHPSERLVFGSSGELLAAFIGTAHHICVVERSFPVPEWASGAVAELIVHDTLLLRHPSGQVARIRADPDLPGAILVERGRDLEESDPSIVKLRVI